MPKWLQIVMAFSSIIGVPGILTLYFKSRFDRHDKADDERNKARIKKETLMLKGVDAAISLGDATAECQQTGKINGNLEKARNYAAEVKHDLRDFMNEQGVQNLI